MRQIEFRAKDQNGEWHYGFLTFAPGNGNYVIQECVQTMPTMSDPLGDGVSIYTAVKHDTIGQFTGLLDKNGVKIWEGDIIKGVAILSDSYGYDSTYNITGVVQYDTEHSAFTFTDGVKHPVENYFSFLWQLDESKTEVIGNIHDVISQVSKEGGEL